MQPENNPNESESKFIKFVFSYNKPKTSVYDVMTNDDDEDECIKLGEIKFYAPWRQYSFFPLVGKQTVFEKTCLADIVKFMIGLNQQQRSKNRRKTLESFESN